MPEGEAAAPAEDPCSGETSNDRKFGEAIALYVELFPDDPDLPEILFRQGRLYYDRGVYDPAVRLFGQLLERFPESQYASPAGELILDSFNRAADYANIETWARRLKSAPAFSSAESQARLDTLIVQSMFKVGEQLAERGEHAAAADAYLRAAEEFPREARAKQALYNAGLERQRAGDLPGAAQAYELLIERHPGTAEGATGAWAAAQMFESIAQFGDAARFYESYGRRFPEGEKAHEATYNAVLLRMTAGDWDEAVSVGRYYLERYPRHENADDVYFFIGRAQEGDESWNDAAATYREYIRRSRNNDRKVEAQTRLAQVLTRAGNERAANEALEDAVRTARRARRGLRDGLYFAAQARYLKATVCSRSTSRSKSRVRAKAFVSACNASPSSSSAPRSSTPTSWSSASRSGSPPRSIRSVAATSSSPRRCVSSSCQKASPKKSSRPTWTSSRCSSSRWRSAHWKPTRAVTTRRSSCASTTAGPHVCWSRCSASTTCSTRPCARAVARWSKPRPADAGAPRRSSPRRPDRIDGRRRSDGGRGMRALLLLVLASASVSVACGGGSQTDNTTVEVPPADPEAVREYLAGVRILQRQGGNERSRNRRARARFEKAIQIDPNLWEAHYNLGVVQRRAEELDAAGASFDEAARIAPQAPEPLLASAEVAYVRGDRDAAANRLERLVEAHPNDLAARTALAVILRERGRYDEGLTQAREVLVRDPQNVRALLEIGRIERARERFDVARLVLDKARQLTAEGDARVRAEVLNEVGLLELDRGDNQAAFEAFEAAVATDANYAPSRMNMGSVLSRRATTSGRRVITRPWFAATRATSTPEWRTRSRFAVRASTAARARNTSVCSTQTRTTPTRSSISRCFAPSSSTNVRRAARPFSASSRRRPEVIRSAKTPSVTFASSASPRRREARDEAGSEAAARARARERVDRRACAGRARPRRAGRSVGAEHRRGRGHGGRGRRRRRALRRRPEGEGLPVLRPRHLRSPQVAAAPLLSQPPPRGVRSSEAAAPQLRAGVGTIDQSSGDVSGLGRAGSGMSDAMTKRAAEATSSGREPRPPTGVQGSVAPSCAPSLGIVGPSPLLSPTKVCCS
ncbi:MAG: tetratricopeptide repeat protein [Sandaracinus sp.]|nr:tetratricopeptide repeat protein [Sandaracinus sp.]